VGMIFFDRFGAVIGSNEVFRHITGYTREEIDSGKLNWRTLTPPEWIPESERQMEQFLLTGWIGPYEKEYWLKDGSRRWMLFNGRKLDNDMIVEYCVDITERRRAELAAQRSEEEWKQLIANLAHELNNPLQIATSALHLLRPDIQGTAVTALEDALQRISALSRQLIEAAENADQSQQPGASVEKKYGT
jgi:PAS domain S-box-containing protein